MQNTINNPWSSDSLLTKSIVYIEQMEKSTPEDWQYGLWSALSLELLARAALANISPVLLADSKNWRNISFALGKAPTARNFSPVSIGAKEVFLRLQELLPTFTNEVMGSCSRHIENRNAELHTGEIAFAYRGTSTWLPRFYQSCDILLKSMGKNLEDFVDDYKHAESLIKSLDDEAAKSIKQEISAHSRVWGNKSKEDKDKIAIEVKAWATRIYGHRVECPACKSTALLRGTPVGAVSTEITDDYDDVTQRQSMLPSSFECIACGLKITGFSKLSACGLGDTFSEKTILSAAEYFNLYTEDDLQQARDEVEASYTYEPDYNE